MISQLKLNRTPEWARLTRTGFFKIDDRPGEIVVSKAPWPLFLCIGFAVLFGFGPPMLNPFLIPLGLLFGGLFTWGALKQVGHGYRVRFTPDELVFYGPLGNHMGSLERVSMQQIAVKLTDEKREEFCHEFIADTGWMQAFWVRGKTRSAVQNNVLMAAFAQPVHLDLLQDAPPFDLEEQPQLQLKPRAAA